MENQSLEYIIKQKNEGRTILKKVGLLIVYALLFVILALIVIIFAAPAFQMLFLILDLILCAMIAFISWRFVCIEYEIVFSSGELVLTVIYGKSIRRTWLTVPINSIYEIGIYDDPAYEKLCKTSLQKNHIAVSSMSAETIYYALFDDGKDHCALYFEVDDRAISYLRRENSSAVRQGNINNKTTR